MKDTSVDILIDQIKQFNKVLSKTNKKIKYVQKEADKLRSELKESKKDSNYDSDKKYKYQLIGGNYTCFLNQENDDKDWWFISRDVESILGSKTAFTDEEIKACPIKLDSFEKIEVQDD